MKLGLVLLGLFAAFHGGNACSCLPMNITDKFCSADFVVRVTVLSDLTNTIDGNPYAPHMYEVDIVHVYRTSVNITGQWVMAQNRIYTAPHSAACGVDNLYEGNSYILSGPLESNNTRLSINICSSIVQQVAVPAENGNGRDIGNGLNNGNGQNNGKKGGYGKGKSNNGVECGEGKVLYRNTCIPEELADLLVDPSSCPVSYQRR